MVDFLDRYRALAELPMEGGYPSGEAAAALAAELYFQRAVQTYLWALPAVNLFATRESVGRDFSYGYQVMAVYEKRLKPNTLITTPNSDVIYGLCFVDLSEAGPLVIDAPPMVQGLVDDAWHRPLRGPVVDGVAYDTQGTEHKVQSMHLGSPPKRSGPRSELQVVDTIVRHVVAAVRGARQFETSKLPPEDGQGTRPIWRALWGSWSSSRGTGKGDDQEILSLLYRMHNNAGERRTGPLTVAIVVKCAY